jgi:hypothetical protein
MEHRKGEVPVTEGIRATKVRDEPTVRVRLPVGGWQIGFLVKPDGRTAVEVVDTDGRRTVLVASTDGSVLSIDAGWVGFAADPRRGKRWWALAVGCTPVRDGRPTVIFTRKASDRVDGLWLVHDGLWVAAATGEYTHVWLIGESGSHLKRLHAV